jgi:hypothetical protein
MASLRRLRHVDHIPIHRRCRVGRVGDRGGGAREDFVLQRAEFGFGRGGRFNGALFPSCSAAKLRRAHGRLSVCPKGSRIGYGVGTERAVAVGVTSSGRLTAFNGPGGRSIVHDFVVVSPVLLNATFEAPIERPRSGRYGMSPTAGTCSAMPSGRLSRRVRIPRQSA